MIFISVQGRWIWVGEMDTSQLNNSANLYKDISKHYDVRQFECLNSLLDIVVTMIIIFLQGWWIKVGKVSLCPLNNSVTIFKTFLSNIFILCWTLGTLLGIVGIMMFIVPDRWIKVGWVGLCQINRSVPVCKTFLSNMLLICLSAGILL